MNEPTSKKANAFLQPGKRMQDDNRELKSVFARIKELDDLQRAFSAHLDPAIKDYCQVANIIGNRLIVVTANSSIATQLRYITAELVKKFRQDPLLQQIQDIHCKVRPTTPSTAPSSRHAHTKAKKVAPLSQETADIIREIAESLNDPKLKEVMKRIAKHVKE